MSMYSNSSSSSRRLLDFPDPFASFSNLIYPRTMKDVLQWADTLWLRNGIYSQAIKRCVRYFITDVELKGEGVDHDTRLKYQQFLIDEVNILDILAQVGDDMIAYGNSFTSISVPITRSLVCPKCGSSRPLDNLEPKLDYEWKNYQFSGVCPTCKTKVVFNRVDTQKAVPGNTIKVIRWSPQHVSVEYCPITGSAKYSYRIPASESAAIKKGSHVYLRSVPWELVEAVKEDKSFDFNPTTFLHIKCATSASLDSNLRGWGLPLFMSNFSQVVHLQILERFNEAIAMDAIMPFRVITPPQGAGNRMDPMLTNNMGNFMGSVRRMLRQHRQDPTSWHTLPLPINYQALGGEAKQLVPVELIDRAQDVLLASMGVPQEFYRTSLSSTGGPPISLRMFEKSWVRYVTQLDDWLNWFVDQVARIMDWESGITAKLERVSVIQDDMTKQVKLNLASAKVISQRTALRAFGLDLDQERAQILEEDQVMNDMLAEQQMKDQRKSALVEAMQPPPPGAPPQGQMPMGSPPVVPPGSPPPASGPAPMMPGGMAPPSAGANPSVDELTAQANDLANQIMSMDPTTRRRTLSDLKKSNPTLHAMVKQMLTDMETGIKSDALAQAKMQASGGGQPM